MPGLIRSLGSRVARSLPRTAYPVLSGPLRGARFILGSFAGAGGGASVFVNRSEPEQLAEFARTVKPGDSVFDVGANVGLYTVLASRLVGSGGKVVAFEPVPRNIGFLRKHIAMNGAENVRVVEAACSNEPGSAILQVGSDFAMGHLVADGESGLQVETVTIDGICEQGALLPDVMKIDVEGAEIDVLNGAAKTIEMNFPTIFLSTHSAELRYECKEILRKLGYELKSLVDSDDPHEFLATHNSRCRSA